MVIHYSLCKTPDPGYHTRTADYRVGHFLNAVTDYGQPNPDTDARADDQPLAARKGRPQGQALAARRNRLSGGSKTTSRSNSALRAAGHSGMEQGVREDRVSSTRSPCGGRTSVTISSPRTSTTAPCGGSRLGSTFAMSGLRSDPMTGEMIDGDVIFDASWIKTWKEEYALLVGVPTPTGTGADPSTGAIPLAMGEVISPIMAMKQGFGPPIRTCGEPPCCRAQCGNAAGPDAALPVPGATGPIALDVVTSAWDPIQAHLSRRMSQGRFMSCNYAAGKASEMRFASLALGMLADAENDKDKDTKDKEPKLPEDSSVRRSRKS